VPRDRPRPAIHGRDPAPQRQPAPPAPPHGLGRGLTREQQRTLYERHFGFVWRNLRRLGVPEAVAEDAAQDVFLVVHRRQGSYDARWSRVETWLFGIVLRVARNHRRRLRRWRFRFDATSDVTELVERRAIGGDAPDEARRGGRPSPSWRGRSMPSTIASAPCW
jgi:hypothetical protein